MYTHESFNERDENYDLIFPVHDFFHDACMLLQQWRSIFDKKKLLIHSLSLMLVTYFVH